MTDKKKIAFTLSEVLITLGIIGVVAAMTMPTLIAKYQKEETINKLKQSYSILAQALKLSEAENGEMGSWDFGAVGCEGAAEFSEKYVEPYLKVTKKCVCDDTNECRLNAAPLNNLNSTTGLDYHATRSVKLFLSNGSILLVVRAPNTDFPIFDIDINGKQKPNVIGKDIFEYEIGGGRFLTRANNFTYDELKTSPLGCHKNGSGDYCSRLIMLDNWEITDRYPW